MAIYNNATNLFFPNGYHFSPVHNGTNPSTGAMKIPGSPDAAESTPTTSPDTVPQFMMDLLPIQQEWQRAIDTLNGNGAPTDGEQQQNAMKAAFDDTKKALERGKSSCLALVQGYQKDGWPSDQQDQANGADAGAGGDMGATGGDMGMGAGSGGGEDLFGLGGEQAPAGADAGAGGANDLFGSAEAGNTQGPGGSTEELKL